MSIVRSDKELSAMVRRFSKRIQSRFKVKVKVQVKVVPDVSLQSVAEMICAELNTTPYELKSRKGVYRTINQKTAFELICYFGTEYMGLTSYEVAAAASRDRSYVSHSLSSIRARISVNDPDVMSVLYRVEKRVFYEH